MSDIKIQSTNPDELKGGDTFVDNNSDAEILSRNATTQSVVFRSFPPAPDVAPGSAGLCSPAPGRGPIENVNSMFVAAPVAVSVKPTDSKTIQGSYAGDHRAATRDTAAASLRTASGSETGPRGPVGQFPLGAKVPAAPAPQSFPADLADSDAGN